MDSDLDPLSEANRVLHEEGPLRFVMRAMRFLWRELSLVFFRFVDWIAGRRRSHPFTLRYTGLYSVQSTVSGVPDFEFWYSLNRPHIRHRVLGEYETEVVEALSDHWTDETTFWEVGAGWGYHSLSAADLVKKVVAFDPDLDRTNLLRRSIEENGYNNVSIVGERIESLDHYTEEYGPPDLILVDIDGWEYDVIPASPELLGSGCVWIVEVHHDVDVPPAESANPLDITELFEQYGYTVERIREHFQRDLRGNKLERLNTHHIVAYPDVSKE